MFDGGTHLGARNRPDVGAELDAAAHQAQARLAGIAERHADVDADLPDVAPEARDTPSFSVEEVERVARQLGVAGHEPALRRRERLVPLGAQPFAVADLHIVAPLGTQSIEPGPAVREQQVEERRALEVGGQSEAEPQVVRAPGLLADVGGHRMSAAGQVGEEIAHALEVAAPVDAAHVAVGLGGVEHAARLRVHRGAHHVFVDALQAFDTHLLDAHVGVGAGGGARCGERG